MNATAASQRKSHLCILQGSHSSWKTWKNDNSFSSPGKVLELYNFIKNPGKMGVNLEKSIVWEKSTGCQLKPFKPFFDHQTF